MNNIYKFPETEDELKALGLHATHKQKKTPAPISGFSVDTFSKLRSMMSAEFTDVMNPETTMREMREMKNMNGERRWSAEKTLASNAAAICKLLDAYGARDPTNKDDINKVRNQYNKFNTSTCNQINRVKAGSLQQDDSPRMDPRQFTIKGDDQMQKLQSQFDEIAQRGGDNKDLWKTAPHNVEWRKQIAQLCAFQIFCGRKIWCRGNLETIRYFDPSPLSTNDSRNSAIDTTKDNFLSADFTTLTINDHKSASHLIPAIVRKIPEDLQIWLKRLAELNGESGYLFGQESGKPFTGTTKYKIEKVMADYFGDGFKNFGARPIRKSHASWTWHQFQGQPMTYIDDHLDAMGHTLKVDLYSYREMIDTNNEIVRGVPEDEEDATCD